MCVCVCVSLLKHYSTALGLAGRKPMWEPDPVLYCAVDCTVNTEKGEVTLVSSSFSLTICLQPYSGCFCAAGCVVQQEIISQFTYSFNSSV